MTNLGTLKKITDLRSIWPHEALNFTPWVAENVDLLADAVGLDILWMRLNLRLVILM